MLLILGEFLCLLLRLDVIADITPNGANLFTELLCELRDARYHLLPFVKSQIRKDEPYTLAVIGGRDADVGLQDGALNLLQQALVPWFHDKDLRLWSRNCSDILQRVALSVGLNDDPINIGRRDSTGANLGVVLEKGLMSSLHLGIDWREVLVHLSLLYQSSNVALHHRPDNITGLVHVEQQDWEMVLSAKRDGRSVHRLQMVCQKLVVANLAIRCGCFVRTWIRRIHSVQVGPFQEDVRSDLDGSEGSNGVRREIRETGPSYKNDDAIPAKVLKGPLADVGLTDLIQTQCRHCPRFQSNLFECRLQSQSVHNCRQHPHVIGCGTVQTSTLSIGSSPDVPAANDQTDLYAQSEKLLHLSRDELQYREIDARSGAALQSLAAEFQHYSLVQRRHGCECMSKTSRLWACRRF